MVTVTRIFEFAYAHCLEGHAGKCQRVHGHNALLEVEIANRLSTLQTHYQEQLREGHQVALKDAMVVDFGDLKKVVEEHILEYLDHNMLNNLFTFHPTAENLCIWIAETIQANMLSAMVVRVRIWETSRCYAEWRRRPA